MIDIARGHRLRLSGGLRVASAREGGCRCKGPERIIPEQGRNVRKVGSSTISDGNGAVQKHNGHGIDVEGGIDVPPWTNHADVENQVANALVHAVDVPADQAHVHGVTTVADVSAVAEVDNMMNHARRHVADREYVSDFEASDCCLMDEVVEGEVRVVVGYLEHVTLASISYCKRYVNVPLCLPCPTGIRVL